MTKKILYVVETPNTFGGASGLEAVPVALLNHREGDTNLWCYGMRPNFYQMYPVQTPDRIKFFQSYGWGQYKFSPAFYHTLVCQNQSGANLLHQHGFWGMALHSTTRWHRVHGRPLLLSLHGAFSPWALKKNSIKKMLARKIFYNRASNEIDVIHASSAQDIEFTREFGYKKPIAVMPNGVSADWLDSLGDAKRFRKVFEIPEDKRILLYCSRLDRGKGLDMLLPAWKHLEKIFPDWFCVIAGTGVDSYKKELQMTIESLKISQTVKMIGNIVMQDKRDAIEAADAFVLPSYSEGFALAVLEALGGGCPCVMTKTCRIPFVEKSGCGWCPDPNIDSLIASLEEAMSKDKETLKRMGQVGKEIVESQFTWKRIVGLFDELYDWMLGEKEKPEFVHEL